LEKQTKVMPKKGTKRNKTQRRSSRRVVGPRDGHLPQLRDQPVFPYVIRYACTETTATLIGSVQPFQLINSLFCAKTAANQVESIVNAIKFRAAHAWAPPGIASGASSFAAAYNGNTVRLGWVNSASGNPNFGRDIGVSDTTISTVPAHVVLRPSRGSSQNQWQVSGSNQPWDMFYSLPPASVLDIHLLVCLNSQESATNDNSAVTTVGSPANGVLYHVSLVGSTGNLVPQNGNFLL